MGFAAAYTAIAAIGVGVQYDASQKAAQQQRQNADRAVRQAQDDANAAVNARNAEAQRDATATAAALAAEAGAKEVGVATIDTAPQGESPAARRRTRATFTGGQGSVSGTGSIRI